MLAIQNHQGYWWTGKLWGCKEARETYKDHLSLPYTLDEQDDEDYLTLWENSTHEDSFDVFYTHCSDDEEILARVYKI